MSLIIALSIVFFGLLGLFGNVSFVFAVYRRREIRSKHGYLLAVNCCLHIVCELFEFFNAAQQFAGVSLLSRNQCFNTITLFLFAISYQAMMYVSFGLDMLHSITRPIPYFKVRNFPYLLVIQLPCLVYALAIVILGFSLRGADEAITACNPPLALPPTVLWVWSTCSLVQCVAVVVLYSSIIVIMLLSSWESVRHPERGSLCSKYSASSTYQKRVMRTMTVLMVFFVFSWFLSAIAIRLPAMFPAMTTEIRDTVQTYAVIPASASFAQTFYVYLLMSREYRRAFLGSGLLGQWQRRVSPKGTSSGEHRLTG